ncbi:hypothetical protein JCM6882_004451 [Rhodosporidiobolus microsporus]
MSILETVPAELLAHILSFLDPFSPQRITSRRDLYNCCLVSRHVRDCAQPLLWRQLSAARLSAAAREADPERLGRHVLWGSRAFNSAHAAEALSLVRLPGVTDVRASGFQREEAVGADVLFPFLTAARHITFALVDLGPTVSPLVFPHLSSLSLSDVTISGTLLTNLLHSSYLPNLRFLYLNRLDDHEDINFEFFASLDQPFLQQLKVLQIGVDGCDEFDATTAEYPDALVVSVSVDDLEEMGPMDPIRPFPMRHFHLQHFQPHHIVSKDVLPGLFRQGTLHGMGARRDRRSQVLADLPSFFARSHLSTVLLPLSLRNPALVPEYQAIVDACAEKRIEVLWEDDEPEMGDDLCLRDEYCRWVVGKQREEGRGMAVEVMADV